MMPANLVRFIVAGKPVAQPRPRFASRGGIGIAYTPGNAAIKAYRDAITLHYRAVGLSEPLSGPVRVTLRFVLPRPKRAKRGLREPHDRRPDLDNLAKGVLDALTGLAWIDDSQICQLRLAKVVAGSGEPPETVIEIEPI